MLHRFQNRIFISFAGLVITLIASASFLVIAEVRNSIINNVEFHIMVTQRVFETVLRQMSDQAVTRAFSFAESGRFKAAVDTRDPETILQLVETQQAIFESDFIMVTDESGNIITNTLDPGLNKQSVSKNFMIGFPSSSDADLAVYQAKLYETAFAPIEIAGYVFGYLIVGNAIDDEQASRFKDITLNEMTFLVNDKITASTLSAEYRTELENYIAVDRRERTDSTAFDIHMGEEVFLSRIAPLTNAANSHVGYYVIQKSLTESYALLDSVTRMLILITVASLLISLALSFFVARGVTAPVNQLVIGANKLARGNYDYEVKVDAQDEIGFLARSFNEMRISLRNSFYEMEKLNIELRMALQDLKSAQEELIIKEQMERELSIAREIQVSLLPRENPEVEGYEVYGNNLSCEKVSGDYYDFFQLADGRWVFAIGDVSGKGVPASLMMAGLQSHLRALLRSSTNIPDIMSTLNEYIIGNSTPDKYVTFFLGILDPASASFEYVNAGHNAPITMDNKMGIRYLRCGGPIIGLLPGLVYTPETIHLDDGQLIACYTDGVTETFDKMQEEYGEERLIAFLKKNERRPLEEMFNNLVAELNTFAESDHYTDDLTIIFLRKK